MSAVSSDSAGITNYTVKRDWRRVLDREVRAEGYDFFFPNTSIPLGDQPYPNAPNISEPITMIHECRRPNGELAIICGTPTRLFRYFSLSDGAYYLGDGTADEYYLGSDYYDDNPGIWLVIGSGFSPQAQRWEVVDLNGLAFLNNGVDLPVSYDVAEFAVKPLYELRESGVAAVGNIAVSNDLLLCADISEMTNDALVQTLSLIPATGITAYQTGSSFPSGVTATLVGNLVTASTGIFNLSMIGYTIQFTSGFSAVIASLVSPTQVNIIPPTPPLAAPTINPGVPFFLISGELDYIVTSSAPIFDSSMVGRLIIWDSGAIRIINQFVDSTHVVVDSNFAVASGSFSFNNPAAYAAYTDGQDINRIQYRIINSFIGAGRRWAATVPGSIMAGTVSLKFEYPAYSFFELIGQQIFVLGAGTDGGNLTAILSYLAPDGMSAVLDTPAVTTVTDALVQASDATGSNVGFIDLQDDGSGIVAMLDLLGNLIVYKDTAIFLGQYTGTTGAPFNFAGNSVYRGDKTLYYRNTLIDVATKGQEFHVFAGRNSFYRYDLVYQQPMEVDSGEVCKDIFFNNVGLPNPTDPVGVFAADNPVTKEIFFCFPNGYGPDYALRYDYFTGQISSTSAIYTAAAGVKQPQSGLQVGVTADWFIMGTSVGSLLRYGLTSQEPIQSKTVTITQAGNTMTASTAFFSADMVTGKSIQFPDLSVVNVTGYVSPTQITVGGPATARASTAFIVAPGIWHRCGAPYDSVLQSGLDNFGNSSGEKDLESWNIALSSKSPNTPLFFELMGCINPNYPPPVLGSKLLTNPKVTSTVGMLFIQNYFQDRITVSGINNPCEIVERIFNIAGVNSKNFVRR